MSGVATPKSAARRAKRPGHDHSAQAPVASGMDLLEFEVVDLG
ncbi:hypothetical protein ACX80D_10185 [Arthrobacter sp. Sr24]